MISDCDRGAHRLLDDVGVHDGAAADRRDEEAVERAPLDLLHGAHAGPHVRRHRAHHHDAGHDVGQVGRGAEAGQFDDPPEQVAEQEQPDHRLDQREHQVPGLADERLQPPVRHPPRVAVMRTHAGIADVPRRVRPRRTGDRRTAGTRRRARAGRRSPSRPATPARSSAASAAGTAAAPSSARALSRRPATVTSRTPLTAARAPARPPSAVRLVAQFDVDGVAAQLGLELVGRAGDDDAAAVHDGHPVGEPVGLLQVVRGEQDGQRLVRGQPADLGPHRGAGLRVEAGRRLVEEQHLRAG